MKWKRISDGIDRVIDFVGSLMVLTTIVCTSINIFSRWIIGRSLGQLDEISLMAFVWAVYIGMGVLYNNDEHITMDFVLRKLPPKSRLVLTVIDIIIQMVVCVLVTFLAVKLMGRSFIRTTNVCHVPYAFLQLSIAIGFALMMMSLVAKLIKIFTCISRKEDFLALEEAEKLAREEGGEA